LATQVPRKRFIHSRLSNANWEAIEIDHSHALEGWIQLRGQVWSDDWRYSHQNCLSHDEGQASHTNSPPEFFEMMPDPNKHRHIQGGSGIAA